MQVKIPVTLKDKLGRLTSLYSVSKNDKNYPILNIHLFDLETNKENKIKNTFEIDESICNIKYYYLI